MDPTPHLPGDWIVTRTGGRWHDRAIAWLIRWVTATRVGRRWRDSTVNHAALFVGPVSRYPEGALVEARPGGAAYVSLNAYPEATWSSGRLPRRLTPTDAQRERIVAAAKGMLGTPYGFLDDLAVGLAQRRTRATLGKWVSVGRPPWWVRRIASRHTLICSQLVDAAWHDGGIDLYPGRLEGLVTPEDLEELLEPEPAAA